MFILLIIEGENTMYNPVVRRHAELMSAWEWVREQFGEEDAQNLALDIQICPFQLPYQVCQSTPTPVGVG